MTLLETRGLVKTFGGLRAVDGASVANDRGEAVGLIGPNGAGKTTFFDCVTGLLDPNGGTVHFDDADVTGSPSHRLARRGLVRTFQSTRELTTMTVEENVKLPAMGHPGERALGALARTDGVSRKEAEIDDRAVELLSLFELDHVAGEYAGNLSGGQRKLLEFARALMADPEMLLLDEPFAGVNPSLERDLTTHVRQLNDDGTTLLVIEHEIETLVEVVDRLIVFDQGNVLTSGPPEEVLHDEAVIDAYLGGPSEEG